MWFIMDREAMSIRPQFVNPFFIYIENLYFNDIITTVVTQC